MYDFGLRFDM